jgi:hypothetical protein
MISLSGGVAETQRKKRMIRVLLTLGSFCTTMTIRRVNEAIYLAVLTEDHKDPIVPSSDLVCCAWAIVNTLLSCGYATTDSVFVYAVRGVICISFDS